MPQRSPRLAVAFVLLVSGCEPQALISKAQPSLASVRDPQPTRKAVLARTHPPAQGVEPELPMPPHAGRERCPDELLPRQWETGAALGVRVRDARLEPKDILPLDLKLALDSKLGLEGNAQSPAEPPARYLLELLVEDYAGPQIFRRLNAPRSEWAAGKLRGRVVVHDVEAGRVLCQAPLSVRGDATKASIRRRLRESTRKQLAQELNERIRSEASKALGQITSVLRLEPLPARVNAG